MRIPDFDSYELMRCIVGIILEFKAAHRLTWDQMQARTGVNAQTLRHYCALRFYPHATTLIEICKGLGMKPSELLAEAERRLGV